MTEPILKDYHSRLYPKGVHIVVSNYHAIGITGYNTAGSITKPPNQNILSDTTVAIWHVKPKEVLNAD